MIKKATRNEWLFFVLYFDFLGCTGDVCASMYKPVYSLHDVGKGYDKEQNKVDREGPYYFSPSSFPSYHDAEGKGYYVFHFLEDMAPLTQGWTNVVQ